MASDELHRYPYIDISGRASLGVSGVRRASPVGALIHSTDGTNSQAWLLGTSELAGNPASTDYLIGKRGERSRLCRDNRFPYHAGKSRAELAGAWRLGDGVSELLLGYELEYLWAEQPTFEQYDSLAEQLALDALKYGWRWPLIIYAHSGVAIPAGRRSDPWLFDWGSLMGRLYVRALDARLGGLVLD